MPSRGCVLDIAGCLRSGLGPESYTSKKAARALRVVLVTETDYLTTCVARFAFTV